MRPRLPLNDLGQKKQCGVLPNCWFKLRSAILVILLCGFKNAWKMSKLIHCMFLFGLKAPTSVCFVYHFPLGCVSPLFKRILKGRFPQQRITCIYLDSIHKSSMFARKIDLTNFGVVIRTPHYLSPEIVNNEARLLFCYLCLELVSRCSTTKDHTRWVMTPGKDSNTHNLGHVFNGFQEHNSHNKPQEVFEWWMFFVFWRSTASHGSIFSDVIIDFISFKGTIQKTY